ncbi:MAG TPA: GrpB family protein [Gemmatimonadaceae bacterium]|nr:GrpB family protein [Gemmatimonadaceae bacterium]
MSATAASDDAPDPAPAASLGLERGTVRLAPHDPAWATLFAAEAARIGSALGTELPLDLEHVGSTAVPGLVAKPILDLLGGYPPGAPVAPYVAALVRAGYVHRGEQGIPGREYFRRGEPRAYHLHLVVRDGPLWREHLAFRDALRADAALRDAYAALKLELARRHARDREAYTEGKGAFVREVVAGALARGSGP